MNIGVESSRLRVLRFRHDADAVIDVPPVEPDSSVTCVVRAAIAADLRRLVVQEEGIRAGEDDGAVHQARVATRRLRATLRTCDPFLEHEWGASLRAELEWLGSSLGAVRDTDVLLGRLWAATGEVPGEDHAPVERMLGELVDRRDGARAVLLDAMRSHRYARLIDDLMEGAAAPPVLDRAHLPARDAAAELMRAPWRKLRRAVRVIGDPPADEELHRVRIRTKQVRYAAESLIGVFERPASRFAAASRALQEILGLHQDAVVAERWLRAASARAGTRSAFAAGRIATLEGEAAARSRGLWKAAWKALSRKDIRFWT
jgi:CHAD domain-containing protein